MGHETSCLAGAEEFAEDALFETAGEEQLLARRCASASNGVNKGRHAVAEMSIERAVKSPGEDYVLGAS